MKRDLEAAAALEEKLKKADEEAEVLRQEQKKIEEEKAKIAAAAASQQKQTEEEVGVCSHNELELLINVLCRGRKLWRQKLELPGWQGKLKKKLGK